MKNFFAGSIRTLHCRPSIRMTPNFGSSKEKTVAINLLHEVAGKPACRFDRYYVHPWLDGFPDEFHGFRSAAELLALDARCKAADDDMRGCFAIAGRC